MIVFCCPECKMVDLGEENEEKKCMRCGIPMLSSGIKSSEWNTYDEERRKEAVSACLKDHGICEVTQQPEKPEKELPQKPKPVATDDDESLEVMEEEPAVEESEEPEKAEGSEYAGLKSVPSEYEDDKTAGNDARFTKMSIIAFVFSLLGCLSTVGIILAIIDLVQGSKAGDNRKKGLSIAAIIIGAVLIIGSLVATFILRR